MTTALEQEIQNSYSQPLSSGEMEDAVRNLTGAVECLIDLWREKLDYESGNFNESINQRAGRRAQLGSPKYTPYRIC